MTDNLADRLRACEAALQARALTVAELLGELERAKTARLAVSARAQLTNTLTALAELIDDWNDAAADDDRGRDHTMLVLTLWDDGSGRIGTAHGYGDEDRADPSGQFYDIAVNLQGGFNDTDGMVDYLLEWVEGSEVWKEQPQ